jgi:hypothetical protein
VNKSIDAADARRFVTHVRTRGAKLSRWTARTALTVHLR